MEAQDKDKRKAKKQQPSQTPQPSTHSVPGRSSAKDIREAIKNRRPVTSTEVPPVPRRRSPTPLREEEFSHIPGKIVSYGQQLQYELKLRGWKPIQLVEKIGIPLPQVLFWVTDEIKPDLASRQKLCQLLGNAYYLSSKVLHNGTLQVRIVQRLPSPQDFSTIFSALTRLHTQFWLIQRRNIDDLNKFAETEDRSYVEKANLIIENLSTKSPALITLLTDPGTVTTIVASGVTLALALNKVIDSMTQAWTKIVDVRIETQKKEAELRNKEAEERRKLIEEAVAAMTKIIDELAPGADQKTRAMMMQAILPKYVECLNGKGNKLDLSPLVICP